MHINQLISKKKILVFDFDGVILNSAKIKTNVFKEIFSNYGNIIQTKIEEYHLNNVGLRRYDKIKYILKNFVNKKTTDQEVNELCDKFAKLTYQKILDCDEIPGVRRFLEKNFKTKKLYISSAAPINELKNIMKIRNFDNFFFKVYGSNFNKHLAILDIIIQNNAKPDNLIFFGDSSSDLIEASRAEVDFVGIGDKSNFALKKPKIIFQSFIPR